MDSLYEIRNTVNRLYCIIMKKNDKIVDLITINTKQTEAVMSSSSDLIHNYEKFSNLTEKKFRLPLKNQTSLQPIYS